MPNKKRIATLKEELEIIRLKNNGLLDPKKVVDYARNAKTALHKKFEWDDSVAGEQYRIWQARQIISLELSVIRDNRGKEITIRSYISLVDDRRNEENNGYRTIIDILSDGDLSRQLLEEAKKDMQQFKFKYQKLEALSGVFIAMDRVK